MHNLSKNIYINTTFIISFFSLISAFYIEHILGYQPCNLCLIERIPYALSILILLINYKFEINQRGITLLLLIIFIFSIGISIYHFGIEQGFFKESTLCSTGNESEFQSKEELLKELQKLNINCKDVTFRILGFSLTTINIFISMFLIILLLKNLNINEKNKK
tara:strand:- start:1957 stop:2445 length:489 start_codon:yes stop_codon:yes gene_type:complete